MSLRKAAEALITHWDAGEYKNCTGDMAGHVHVLRDALVKPEWVGLNSFDRTFLRTTYAPLKPLHHIKETDTTIVAEVVNDWEAFFTAIEGVLKEKNT